MAVLAGPDAPRRGLGPWVACAVLAAACASHPGDSPLSAGETGPEREIGESRVVHGIPVTLRVRDGDPARGHAAIDLAFAAAERTAGLLLAGLTGSEIDILARVPSHLWLEISEVTYDALTEAVAIAEETDGAYEPTWTALRRVWGLRDGETPRVPRDFEIDMALQRVDWTDLEVSDEDGVRQARRMSRRTEIDLGGLARGAMLDAALAQLRLSGSPAGRASTPFEHAVYGGSDGAPWQIEIAVRGADSPVGVLSLREGAAAVASRGPDIPTAEGTVIHDRFDPRSGRPAGGLRWVVAAARRASASAAYADALFALGGEARTFVESRRTPLAVLAPVDGEPWTSPGLAFRAD